MQLVVKWLYNLSTGLFQGNNNHCHKHGIDQTNSLDQDQLVSTCDIMESRREILCLRDLHQKRAQLGLQRYTD